MGILSILCTICAEFIAPTFTGGKKKKKKKAAEQVVNKYTPHTHTLTPLTPPPPLTHTHTHTPSHSHSSYRLVTLPLMNWWTS